MDEPGAPPAPGGPGSAAGDGARAPVPADAGLLLACRALHQAVGACEEAASQALGLGRTDLRALNLLEEGPRSPAWLAQTLHLTRPAVTALVDRLHGAGWVDRAPDPNDRRGVSVQLRPERWRQLAAVYRPIGIAVHASVADLPPEQADQLTASLARIAAALDDAALGVSGRGGDGRGGGA